MEVLRVMSWNVENLFHPGDVVSKLPRKIMEQSTYEAKLKYLAQVISEVAPEVVALQELGGAEESVKKSLRDLNRQMRDAYPHSRISSHADGRNIRVGFLSKYPIQNPDEIVMLAQGELSEVTNWRSKDPVKTLGRGALVIEVEPAEGVRVRLVTLHLKSKLITYDRPSGVIPFVPRDENERAIGAGLALLRRTAEAVAVRIYLNDRMRPYDTLHTVVLGDLNDEPRAATSQILNGPADKDVTREDADDHVRLYNLMAALPRRGGIENDKWLLTEGERFTRIYEGQGELIDHILVSRGLLGEAEELKADDWGVEVRSLVVGIQGQSVGTDATARVGKHVPDHAPIYATFKL